MYVEQRRIDMEIRKTPRIEVNQPHKIVEGKTEQYEKKIGALSSSYHAQISKDLVDQIAYKVVSIPTPSPATLGSLNFGITYLYPYTIDGEYSLTRGHFHADRNYDEYYYGIQGYGYLLYWDGKDDVFAEEVFPGSIHYINGKYAHRLINTHPKDIMAVGCCWNVMAGHDYETIDRLGFPLRCFNVNGKAVWK
jgi:glucose-6-phosphate isomerase, archaeal